MLGGAGYRLIEYSAWGMEQGVVPFIRFAIECLLRESGLLVDEVAVIVLISGLTFREDFGGP